MKQRVALALALALRPQVRAARRADHRARRRRPARHPGPARASCARARLRGAVHQPRPRHRHGDGRPGDGDVRRRARRGPAAPPTCVTAHHHPYTRRAARLVRRPARRGRRGRLHPGPAAGPVARARRLPVRAALPGRGRRLPHRSPRAAAGRPRLRPVPARRGRGRGRPAAGSRGAGRAAGRGLRRGRAGTRRRGRRAGAGGRRRQQDLPGPPEPHDDDHPGGGRRVVRAAPRTGQRAGRPERLAARRRIARLVTGVERPTRARSGSRTTQVDQLGRRALRRYRRHVQLVFQDPFSALNPTRTVAYAIGRPLRNHLGLDKQAGPPARAASCWRRSG